MTTTTTKTALTVAVAALRAQGKDQEADDLEASYHQLERTAAKKDRHVRTHKGLPLAKPWADPMLDAHTGEKFGIATMAALGKISVTKAGPGGVDFGPPPDGYQGLPQKGSTGTPALHIASWISSAIEGAGPDDVEAAVHTVAARIERKLDAIMLTCRTYQIRAWHMATYLMLRDRLGSEEAARAAMEKDFEWLTAYDPAAVEEAK